MDQNESAAALAADLERLAIREAAERVATEPEEIAARGLTRVRADFALSIFDALPEPRREAIVPRLPRETVEQWRTNRGYDEDSVGRLMDPPYAVFRPEETAGEAIERLREIVKRAFVTYGYVVDREGRLLGVIVFRELLFADAAAPLSAIMLRDPFALRPESPVLDAMRDVLHRHFPVYPVCDADGRLVGIVRGQTLFARQAIEISAQVGSLVGVEKEERVSTPWQRSLFFRHPWLQFNLVTAFVAAAVVGVFEATIEQIVALAVFLPVLAGQSGNTGCQALAVTLRGMTLGELSSASARTLVAKEAWLGFLNGTGTGTSAAIGMLAFTWMKGDPNGPILALVVLLAMMGSCVASGIAGAMVPLTLRRLGADPATASSIFLTTATDVASMGLFLGLATVLIL